MNILRAWKDRRGKAGKKHRLPTSRTWPLSQDSGFGSSSISSLTTTSSSSYRSASLDFTTTPAMRHSERVLSGPTRRHLHRSDSHSHPLPPPSPPLHPHHPQHPLHLRGPTPPLSTTTRTTAGATVTAAAGPSLSRRFMAALTHLRTSLKKPSVAQRPDLDSRTCPIDLTASSSPSSSLPRPVGRLSRSHSYISSTTACNAAPFTVHSFLAGQSAPSSPSALVPEIAAPAIFPGTGPIEIAAKRQQLLQIQQSAKRKSTLSPTTTPLTPSSTTASLATVASTVSSVSPAAVTGFGGKAGRHLIPHHHNDTTPSCSGSSAVSGLDLYSPSSYAPPSPILIRRDSASSYTSSISLSSSRYAPALPSSDPPSPRLQSLSPLGISQPISIVSPTNWKMPTRRDCQRPSLTTRSMDEMEVVIVSSSPTASSLPQEATLLVREGEEGPERMLIAQRRDPFLPLSLATSKSLPVSKSSGGQRRLGHGYDISTMFRIGPLDPVPAHLMPLSTTSNGHETFS